MLTVAIQCFVFGVFAAATFCLAKGESRKARADGRWWRIGVVGVGRF